MISTKKLFIVTLLAVSLSLAGCAAQKSEQVQSTKSNTETADTTSTTKSLSIGEGTKNMRDVIKQMKTELTNKEEEKAVKTSDNLEGNWKVFEDSVKEKYSALYEKIEDPLHTITAAVKVKPLDVKTVNTAMDNLDKELQQLQLKDLTANGIQSMRATLKDMKSQLSNKESDKAVSTSANLEGSWKQFEDSVKAESPALYEKVEDPLHTINAAVKIKPLDTNALNSAIDKLDAALAELQK
ncbi:MAG: hypothetical protein K0R54_3683 [Clostridiaceae bacterium]|nr:hypothetical protein [Clostridiaceae bacterium]